MTKKTLYIDMDGVIADFDGRIKKYEPSLHTGDEYPDYESRSHRVNAICEANPRIFKDLKPIKGSIEAVKQLFPLYDLYFLSTPMWNVPESFMDKRLWLEQHFQQEAEHRLILTHRKDLNLGHYLVDDRKRNGVENFEGIHIHYGTDLFPNWDKVLRYLKQVHK